MYATINLMQWFMPVCYPLIMMNMLAVAGELNRQNQQQIDFISGNKQRCFK